MHATVGKSFDFPASHVNTHHSGACSRLHGHTWTLEIICRGPIVTDDTRSDAGMVIDFYDLKKAYAEVIEPYVEHQHLNDTIDLPEYTTELLAAWAFKRLEPLLPALDRVRVYEGKSSWAEFSKRDKL